jgi:hypothetical protein
MAKLTHITMSVRRWGNTTRRRGSAVIRQANMVGPKYLERLRHLHFSRTLPGMYKNSKHHDIIQALLWVHGKRILQRSSFNQRPIAR